MSGTTQYNTTTPRQTPKPKMPTQKNQITKENKRVNASQGQIPENNTNMPRHPKLLPNCICISHVHTNLQNIKDQTYSIA